MQKLPFLQNSPGSGWHGYKLSQSSHASIKHATFGQVIKFNSLLQSQCIAVRAKNIWLHVKKRFHVLALINRLNDSVYGNKSFLSKESDTLRSDRVYISPTM